MLTVIVCNLESIFYKFGFKVDDVMAYGFSFNTT